LGDADAKAKVGQAYLLGIGTPQNLPQGLHWLNQALEVGNKLAAYAMASAYIKGLGVTRDEAKAFPLLKLAAEAEHMPAYYEFGVMLILGKGNVKDVESGMLWLEKAAEHGDERATQLLARLKASIGGHKLSASYSDEVKVPEAEAEIPAIDADGEPTVKFAF
jgi:TPR repeat protein